MRYETALNEMLKGLGFLKMNTGSAAAPMVRTNWDYGAKQESRRMDRYRAKRRIKNQMARESRRRNR